MQKEPLFNYRTSRFLRRCFCLTQSVPFYNQGSRMTTRSSCGARKRYGGGIHLAREDKLQEKKKQKPTEKLQKGKALAAALQASQTGAITISSPLFWA